MSAAAPFELYDYQKRAVEQIEAASRPLYVLPTGGGKTIVIRALVERATIAGKRVLIITHRREILRQTSLKMPGEHGLIQACLLADLSHAVQIASIQTLHARCMRTDKLPLPVADLVIIDECHHVRARTWEAVIDAYPNAKVVGVSATPCRSDGRGLGNYFAELIEGPQNSGAERGQASRVDHLLRTGRP
jgi:DNA repair protein RadD